MVGASELATVNEAALVADPPGAVTAIVPVVAPAGTVTVSCVAVAAETVAPVPWNVTVFWFAVVENPVPRIVTGVPIGPLAGVNAMRDTCDEACRPIARMLPTASYVYVAVSPPGLTTAISRPISSYMY
jgi:hypothetical protein